MNVLGQQASLQALNSWFAPNDPPAPEPHDDLLGFLAFFRALNDSPIKAWPKSAYEKPYIHLPGDRFRPGLLLATDPAMVKRIMLDRVSNYDKGEVVRRRLRPMLGDGILIAGDESWRPQRRITAPLFQHRRVVDYWPTMRSLADREAGALKTGTVVDMYDRLIGLTYGMIAGAAFSDDGVRDPAAFSRAIADYFSTLGRVDLAAYLGLPSWVPTINRLRSAPSLRWFRREIARIVDQRATRIDSSARVPDDLLTQLLTSQDPKTGQPLSIERVQDNTLVFLGAGHETTANLMGWILFLLSEHPDWDAKLANEIKEKTPIGPEQLDQLPLMQAVINETLRLYPPAPIIPREALAADQLTTSDGETVNIEAGTLVFSAPFVAHRHRGYWTEPNSFEPNRFLHNPEIDRFLYFPFGAGQRICIGARFAIQEVMAILLALLPRFRFIMVDASQVFPRGTITLRPADRLMMRVIARD